MREGEQRGDSSWLCQGIETEGAPTHPTTLWTRLAGCTWDLPKIGAGGGGRILLCHPVQGLEGSPHLLLSQPHQQPIVLYPNLVDSLTASFLEPPLHLRHQVLKAVLRWVHQLQLRTDVVAMRRRNHGCFTQTSSVVPPCPAITASNSVHIKPWGMERWLRHLLRIHSALTEDPRLVPSTLVRQLTTSLNVSFRDI